MVCCRLNSSVSLACLKICTVGVWEFCALRRPLKLCLHSYNNSAEIYLRQTGRVVLCRRSQKSLYQQTRKLGCLLAKIRAHVNGGCQNTDVAGCRSVNWPHILWWPPIFYCAVYLVEVISRVVYVGQFDDRCIRKRSQQPQEHLGY